MTYRKDIDGLRAIAVTPVVLMHAGVPYFDGGFVGVDVFFVISGYLITSLLLKDLAANRFSIIEFYERRFRRIFPALAATLAFSIIVGHLLLFPTDFVDFTRSMIATLGFASNILFNRKLGYFSLSAERTPLLHTWSLGVEEQFYIVFPLALFLITRFLRKQYVTSLALILGASFALSIWQVRQETQSAFFLIPARTWELLTGAMLATTALPSCGRKTARLLGFAGLCLIGWSVFRFSQRTLFPGPNALFPCLGAALIIYGGKANHTIVGRLLSTRPLVFTGAISYSLYLWHWVIIGYWRYSLARPFTALEVVGAIVGSFTIAAVSWRFIESPFRKRDRGLSRKGVFAVVGTASAALGAWAGFVFLSEGLPKRFSAEINQMVVPYRPPLACRDLACRVGTPGKPETFLVWGDSHALALGEAFDTIAREKGVAGVLVGRPTCAPLLGFRRYGRLVRSCENIGADAMRIVKAKHIKNIVIHARWAVHIEDVEFGQESGAGADLSVAPPSKDNYPVFEGMLRETLVQLKNLGVNIYILASVPEAGMDVPFVFARSQVSGLSRTITLPLQDFEKRQKRAFLALQHYGDSVSAHTLYPHELLCDKESCFLTEGAHPLYGDDHHLNRYGVMKVRPMIEELLSRPEFASN
jgi:peptidoglycan/LPS O-acetylase OafA/YrhL